MAYQLINQTQSVNNPFYEFVCDSDDDIVDIPTKYVMPNSLALIPKGGGDTSVWIVNASKEWIKL